MRQPIENLPRGLHAVNVLWPEEFGDEHWIVHGANDILQHALRLVERHVLSLQSLRKDVHHLAAHVDDQHRHREGRHGSRPCRCHRRTAATHAACADAFPTQPTRDEGGEIG